MIPPWYLSNLSAFSIKLTMGQGHCHPLPGLLERFLNWSSCTSAPSLYNLFFTQKPEGFFLKYKYGNIAPQLKLFIGCPSHFHYKLLNTIWFLLNLFSSPWTPWSIQDNDVCCFIKMSIFFLTSTLALLFLLPETYPYAPPASSLPRQSRLANWYSSSALGSRIPQAYVKCCFCVSPQNHVLPFP